MQLTTVRSKEKDYDIYLKSEKLVHSQQEHEKNVSQLFGSGKNWFLAISSLTNIVVAIWRQKNVDACYYDTFLSLQIAATVFVRPQRQPQAHLYECHQMRYEYNLVLNEATTEKFVHSNQEHEKNVSQLFGSGKNWFLAISSLTNTVSAIWRGEKVDPSYLDTKNVVHNCQEKVKRL